MSSTAPEEWLQRISAVLSHKYSNHPNTIVKFKVKFSGLNIQSYLTKDEILSTENGPEALKYYLRKKLKNRALSKLLSFDRTLVPLARMATRPAEG